MKDRLCFTIKADGRKLTVRYSSRELKFLGGKLLPAGERFVIALGMWDNFTVARGQDCEAWTSRSRNELLAVANELLESIIRDRELLAYDYQYSFSSQPRVRNTAGTGVLVDGQSGIIDARKPGQIYARMIDGSVRDLRLGDPVVTNIGTVKIHRRKNKIDWLSKLPNLIEYLHFVRSDLVQIRHHVSDAAQQIVGRERRERVL